MILEILGRGSWKLRENNPGNFGKMLKSDLTWRRPRELRVAPDATSPVPPAQSMMFVGIQEFSLILGGNSRLFPNRAWELQNVPKFYVKIQEFFPRSNLKLLWIPSIPNISGKAPEGIPWEQQERLFQEIFRKILESPSLEPTGRGSRSRDGSGASGAIGILWDSGNPGEFGKCQSHFFPQNPSNPGYFGSRQPRSE